MKRFPLLFTPEHDHFQPLARPLERHAMVRLRLHPPAQHELPAHRPLPDVPFHLHGGPDGEHAGRLGQLAPKAFLQRGPLLHHQREPVGPDGDCDPSFLHDGGDHGPGVAVGSLPLQGHPPHLRDQLLQQLLLPGLHDPRTLFLTVKTIIVKLLPCWRPEAVGGLWGPLGVLLVSGSVREHPCGYSGVGRARLLHAA